MKKNSRLRVLLAAIVMVLPLAFGFVGNGAQAAEKDTQKVIIHKMAFDTMPGKIDNTGDIMTEFGDKTLDGAVFTAYDVTKEYWKTYDATEGTDEAKTEAAQAAVLKLTDLTGKSSYEFAATANGVADLELPKKANDKDGQLRNAIYLFKETQSPAGVVQSKSADFILGLPVYDKDTDTEKAEVHVYPKNETEVLTFEFTKYGVEEDGKTNNVLAGAEFILKDKLTGKYYSTENGKFTADETTASKITSDKDGKVTVDGLVLNPGSYEFYEVDSTVSTSQEQGIDTKEIFHYAKNPMVIVKVSPDMEVSYIYYDINGNKVTNASSDAKAYNYKVPAPTKEAEDHDVDTDQVFNFEITQLIPTDIADYNDVVDDEGVVVQPGFALVDTFDPNLQLVNTDATALKNEIKASMSAEMKELVSGVTINAAKNTFTVNFDLAKVKENAGKTISFKVQMSVKDGATWGGEITNDITFDNNFHDKKGSDSVKTYGKKFVKQDADTSKALAKAQFVVKKGNKYLMIDENGKHSWGTSKEDAFKFTSDENGKFEVSGLAKTPETGDPVADNGDIAYELEEVVAPDGYALLKDTIKFTADDGVETLPVVNKHKGSLPSTGGKGIVAFVAVGVVAIAGAGLYFMKGRKHIEG
ncbi:pilin N-terminal domain-containing protein [Enterococcus asini]|uniref:pilin N-terminal domain-containing protein n=1 Tax=Enterococcus asini TaxID=57732 RepID=UPI00288EB9FC|nr:pilin N-terminal domain-containing protein [Enterococcus asini]MDT2756309.1 pilin N-terminal domain-containing protein [Enterococcus asini]